MAYCAQRKAMQCSQSKALAMDQRIEVGGPREGRGGAVAEAMRAASSLTMDCPLCAGIGAPPPVFNTTLTQPSPLSFALLPIEAARIASATAPPLPSRGPPTSIR